MIVLVKELVVRWYGVSLRCNDESGGGAAVAGSGAGRGGAVVVAGKM